MSSDEAKMLTVVIFGIVIFIMLIRLFILVYKDGVARHERIKARAKKINRVIDKIDKKI